MIGLQIIAIIFALWMIYFSNLHFRRGEFKRLEYIFWQILWIGLIIIVLFPGSVNFILKTFRINRTFDLVVIVAIVILFGISFRSYIIVRRLEKKIEELTRNEAIKEIDKKL